MQKAQRLFTHLCKNFACVVLCNSCPMHVDMGAVGPKAMAYQKIGFHSILSNPMALKLSLSLLQCSPSLGGRALTTVHSGLSMQSLTLSTVASCASFYSSSMHRHLCPLQKEASLSRTETVRGLWVRTKIFRRQFETMTTQKKFRIQKPRTYDLAQFLAFDQDCRTRHAISPNGAGLRSNQKAVSYPIAVILLLYQQALLARQVCIRDCRVQTCLRPLIYFLLQKTE